MTLLVIRDYKPSVAGYLSRWGLQVCPGVFVGDWNARIRDELVKLLNYLYDQEYFGGATLVTAHPEGGFLEGFSSMTIGVSRYQHTDSEGLLSTGRVRRTRKKVVPPTQPMSE